MSTTRNASPRPLTARSLIASLLLGLDPPRTTGQFLVRSNELFGVSEGTTRTALSRMVAAAELVSSDGHYELSGDLLARRERQAESRRAERLDWDGTWVLAVIDRERRSASDRAALRRAAQRLHLVEWREGLWCRPDNLPQDRIPDSQEVVAAQCRWVSGANIDAPPLDRFGLDEWAAEARRLIDEIEALRPALADALAPALAAGFVLSADAIRHVGADPLVPDELLPPRWPGDELRRALDRHQSTFRQAHRRWFRPQ